jgi:hypothetical protein
MTLAACLGKILEKQHLKLKTLDKVGENVSLIMNQENKNWITGSIVMSPSRSVQSLK